MAEMEWRCAKGGGTPDESCQYGIRSVAVGKEQSVHQGARISKTVEDIRDILISVLGLVFTNSGVRVGVCHSWSRKNAYDLMKIENRSRKNQNISIFF